MTAALSAPSTPGALCRFGRSFPEGDHRFGPETVMDTVDRVVAECVFEGELTGNADPNGKFGAV